MKQAVEKCTDSDFFMVFRLEARIKTRINVSGISIQFDVEMC